MKDRGEGERRSKERENRGTRREEREEKGE